MSTSRSCYYFYPPPDFRSAKGKAKATTFRQPPTSLSDDALMDTAPAHTDFPISKVPEPNSGLAPER